MTRAEVLVLAEELRQALRPKGGAFIDLMLKQLILRAADAFEEIGNVGLEDLP